MGPANVVQTNLLSVSLAERLLCGASTEGRRKSLLFGILVLGGGLSTAAGCCSVLCEAVGAGVCQPQGNMYVAKGFSTSGVDELNASQSGFSCPLFCRNRVALALMPVLKLFLPS